MATFSYPYRRDEHGLTTATPSKVVTWTNSVDHNKTADNYVRLSNIALAQHDHIKAEWYAQKAKQYREEANEDK